MAANIKGLTVEIGGDTTKLGKALEDVNKKSRSLSTELGQINRLLKLDPGNADLLAQKQKVLAEAVETTAEKLKTLKAANEKAAESAKNYTDWKAKYDPISAKIDEVTDKLKKLRAEQDKTAEFDGVESDAYKGLQAEIDETVKHLKTLKKQAAEVNEEFGNPASPEQLRELQREVITTEKKMDSYARAAKETEQAIKGVGDESKNTEKASSDLGKTLGGVVVQGLAAVAAVAAAAAAGLATAAVNAAAYADDILTMSTVTGMSTDDLQAFTYATGLLDVEVGTLTKSLAKNTKSMQSAATGSQAYVDAYARLGVSVTDANGNLRDGETVYWEAIDALGQMGNETERDAIAMQLFGKSAQELNPLIEAGAETVNGLKQEAKDVGAVLSGETLTALGEFDDSIQRFKGSAEAAKNALGGVLLPELQLLTDTGTELLNEFTTKLNASGGGLDGFVTTVGSMSGKLAGVVQKLASSILSAVPKIAGIAGQLITKLVQGITTNLPTVVSKGAELLGKLGEGIKTAMPGLISKGLDIIMGLVTALYNAAPKLIDAGFGFIKNLVQGLMNSLPTLISKAPEIISKFVNILNHNVPRILKHGVDIVLTIAKGIVMAIPTLVKNIPKIIQALVDVWQAFNWVNLGKTAFTAVKNGITAMTGALKTTAKNIMNAITNALKALPGKLLALGKTAMANMRKGISGMIGAVRAAGGNVFRAIINAVRALPGHLLSLGQNAMARLSAAISTGVGTVKTKASSLVTSVVNVIKTLPKKVASVGSQMVQGIWKGISSSTQWIKDKIKGWVGNVEEFLKNLFGIASPSKLMRDEIGVHLPSGIAAGVEKNAKSATNAMARLAGDMVDAAEPDVGGLGFERSLNFSGRRRAVFGPGGSDLSGAAVLEKLDAIYQRLNNMQVFLDSGALVGGIAEPMDAVLAMRQTLRARGV